jgi:ABC-type multidrug transport system fused ATPase/permease subunit
MKRLESIARSPMYSLFGEILQGHSTIRAYGRVENFTRKFFQLTDHQLRNFFVFWMANRWLALRLDVVSNFIVIAVAILGVVVRDNGGGIDPNLLGAQLIYLCLRILFSFFVFYLGIGLVYSLQLTALLQWTVRMTIDAETNATSVERLLAFVDITPEKSVTLGDGVMTDKKDVPVLAEGDVEMTGTVGTKYNPVATDATDEEMTAWPKTGEICFDNLKIRYRPDLQLVLHGGKLIFL